MHLENQIALTSETATDQTSLPNLFAKQIKKGLERFPHLFDSRLFDGLERLIANSSKDFVSNRSEKHLRTLLLAQFFLQKKMEEAIRSEKGPNKNIFLKVFRQSSKICIALTFHDFYRFHHEQLIKTIHTLLPGIHEIPRSFYLWHHPEMAYLFCYVEIYKLRGEEFSIAEIKEFESSLAQHLTTIPPLTPALFWPYNEEESYRQVQLLQREIHSPKDLPHVHVHFREQTPESLEFLIHLVRPNPSDPLEACLKRFPASLHTFCHFMHHRQTPFPMESSALSIKIPSSAFDVRESINLLYVRRYVLKYLEEILGTFRDYNGGLFEKQQQHFETIRMHLGDKIRNFDIFAEKVFYAIHPVERRLSLKIDEAEDLFTAFSHVIADKNTTVVHKKFDNVIIFKTTDISDQLKLSRNAIDPNKTAAQARLSLGGFHYYCLFCPREMQISSFLETSSPPKEKTKTFKLIFQEGAPLSLNPYHSYGDMRSRLLSKLLFEGLMRLNALGNPEPAGAVQVSSSSDGMTYTFKLRPSYWSNGEKVTAADYVMSLQCALGDHVSHPELLFVLKNARLFKEKKVHPQELGVSALNAETLQIKLEWPDPHFLHKLASPYFFPLFGTMREPKWFNGPFLVREQNKNGILLERNPYFWDSKRPFFDQVDIRWVNDVNTIFSLFSQGKADWIGDPISPLSPLIAEELKNEGKLHMRKTSRQFSIVFNTKHPILSNASIRRALSMCIDRVMICKNIFSYCDPLPPFLPETEEAKRLFELGLQELGLSKEQFPALTFSYSHQTRREDLAQYLQSAWKETLGIHVNQEKMEWNIFRNKLEKGLFEITGTIVETLDEDSLEFYERIEGQSSWNFSQWTCRSYREAIASAQNKPQRNAMLLHAKQILLDQVPFTPLFTYTHLWAHHPDLENYLIDNEGCIDFSHATLQGRIK
ncbi:MAG: peptide ABC transporter substrate-binding protein [Verrucomicrobia bacterium]|nr:peptide ABC transporter substrate-binding protein [Verrucomicrobiota bacterium]